MSRNRQIDSDYLNTSGISGYDSIAEEQEDVGYPPPGKQFDDSGECLSLAQTTKWTRLSKILRQIGSIVLIASSVTFLLQQWVGLDSILRYYSFLGFTALLSVAGIFCAVGLKEEKGARTFFGIATLFLPIHFAQLGALVFSRFVHNPQLLFGDQAEFIRHLAIYQAPSALAAISTVLIAISVLVPISFAGFSALARVEAKRLTGLFFAVNVLLLLPTRAPDLIAIFALVGFSLLIYADFRYFSKPSAMKTWEGGVSRLMLFVPLALIVGRSLFLYPTSSLIFSALAAIAAALLFMVVPNFLKEKEPQAFVQCLSIVPTAIAWSFFINGAVFEQSGGLLNYFIGSAKYNLLIPLNCLPLAVIFAAMSFRVVGSGYGYRRFAAAIAILPMLFQLFTVSGILTSFLCIVTAIIVIASAFVMEEKGLFHLGSGGLAVGLLYHLRYAADIFSLSPWLSLAITGAATIIIASYIERNHLELVRRLNGFKKEVHAWS